MSANSTNYIYCFIWKIIQNGFCSIRRISYACISQTTSVFLNNFNKKKEGTVYKSGDFKELGVNISNRISEEKNEHNFHKHSAYEKRSIFKSDGYTYRRIEDRSRKSYVVWVYWINIREFLKFNSFFIN